MPLTHTFPLLTHLWFSMLTCVLLEGVAVYCWQFRKEAGGLPQTLLQATKGLWIFGLIMINQPMAFGQRILWAHFTALCSLLAAVCWYLFIVEVSGYDHRQPRWFQMLVYGFALFSSVVVFTNPWHQLFWNHFFASGAQLSCGVGWLGRLCLGIGYLLVFYSFLISILWERQTTGLRKILARLYIFPGLIAWAGHILNIQPGVHPFEPLTQGLLISSLVNTFAFFWWRGYSIVPYARQAATRRMIDGLLVIDSDGYIVELNDAAQELFHALPVKVGMRLSDAVAKLPPLAPIEFSNRPVTIEACLRAGEPVQFLQVVSEPLQTPSGHALGRVLIFHDVTRESRQHAHLVEQQKTLARIRERQLLGRELHDGPGQIFSFLAMQTAATRRQLAAGNLERADEQLAEILSALEIQNQALRQRINGLQQPSTVGMDLVTALSEQLARYEKACGLETRLECDFAWPAGLLSPLHEEQILRILQEAMTNVRKSAHAAQLTIHCTCEEDALIFQVVDDGCGFNLPSAQRDSGHHGLRIMQERAEEIGAELRIDSHPGRGTTVELRIPADPARILEIKADGDRLTEAVFVSTEEDIQAAK